jgi:undecaprenyl-diphosphatase
MNLIQAVIMAIVEGVTEFLPISSTAHLMLTARILNIFQSEFVKSFEIVIQLGAILAVVQQYAVKVNRNRKILTNTLIAFVPTGILGFIFYKFVKSYLLGNEWIAIIAMAVGGILLVKITNHKSQITNKSQAPNSKNQTINDLSIKNLLMIGLFQSVSMVPGVSRALATIFGGMMAGLSRKEAVEFSFLLAVPTMTAATGWDLIKSGWSFSAGEWGILTAGFLGSMITAWITVKWLVGYVETHDFRVFGWYRVLLAAVWLAVRSVRG